MSLLTHLATIEDPRRDINKKHELLHILFLTVSAVLSGAEGWADIKEFGDEKLAWLRRCRPAPVNLPGFARIRRGRKPTDPMPG